ncbi:hypothetical protein ANCCEY_04092 [Ancylostoma ceylanicum]|uniref:Integrase catalytic domain-containing protein n=1 Tax=Ancylostoma ceylanicum TaxID=53326 RepID=A0A0D6LXP3_9BILA|nr:hypothetical protein ANCCEY_04092 [Ancylostoma ceylanicum]
MSQLGYHKAQLTKAGNALRKKIADVDPTILERVILTGNPGTDTEAVLDRKQCLIISSSIIDHAVSFLKSRWVAAQEFARENPDENGEFPFLDAIQAHWDAGDLDEAMVEADTLLIRLDAASKLLPTPEAILNSPARLSAASSNVGHNSSSPGQNSMGNNTPPVHASDLPQEGCNVQPGNGFPHGSGSPSGPPHNPSLAYPPGLTSFPPPGLSNGYSLGQNFNLPNAPAYEQPLKLPAFELPEFNGEIDAFPQFWDLFSTAVHNNTSVPVALKFMYLKTHLEGNAANLIANFQPTAQNYEDAVRVLLNTYNRPEILRSRLWDKLINQRASTDAPISQRTTLCAVQALWSQMKHVNEDGSAIGTLKLIRSKFPKRTREKDLWQSGHSWDDPLGAETTQKWDQIVQEIADYKVNVPRFVGRTPENTYDIVVCSDASKRVYAAAAYVITRPTAGKPNSTLLFAKAKLTPPGATTIPRMELLACHLAAKMLRFLRSQLNINLHSVRFLTDSQIVLYWIHSSKPLKTYVANRVKYIREVLDELKSARIECGFHYVATDDNPADCATRGLTATEIQDHMWWSGPPYITTPFLSWPHISANFSANPPPGGAAEEQIKIVGATTTTLAYKSPVPFDRTNSYIRLVRTTAYVLKYLAKLFRLVRTKRRSTDTNKSLISLGTISTKPSISAEDFSTAELVVIREHYRERVEQLDSSSIKRLRTEQDKDGIIRVHQRMAQAELDQTSKNPILLVPGHPLSNMVIMYYHTKLFHAGVSHLVSALRERFFIPKLKRLVAFCISNCAVCRRQQGRFYPYPDPPDLPPKRVTRSRPFQNIGLDYFGPISVRSFQNTKSKVWVSLFTCMSTRALHLEVVNDNSTTQFLLAFRRFMARRGTPDSVLSDNAPTFKLGREILVNELAKMEDDPLILQFTAENGLNWNFITPYSPWKGGFYERLVGSVKACLKKVVQKQCLDIWTFETVLFEIEATLNTRPLIPVTVGQPDQNLVLRPIDLINPHFRLGRLNNITPIRYELSTNESYESLTSCYEDLRRTLDQFWDLWHKEYLAALAEKNATRSSRRQAAKKSPQVGDVVLIRQENIARSMWPMGLVLELHRSKDGLSRSARLRTGNKKIVERSVNQLVPLEITAVDVDNLEKRQLPPAPTRIQPPRAAKRSRSVACTL